MHESAIMVSEHLAVTPRTLYLTRIKYDLMGDGIKRAGRKRPVNYSKRMTWGDK